MRTLCRSGPARRRRTLVARRPTTAASRTLAATRRRSPRPLATIAWFRRDLRLADNPAWSAARNRGGDLCAVFVVDPQLLAAAGAARVALLRHHLGALDSALRELGGVLRVERGDPASVMSALAESLGADRIVVNGDVTPFSTRRDRRVAAATGIEVETHWGGFVHPPGTVLSGTGRVSRVFTPFHRAWEATPWPKWAMPAATDRPATDRRAAGVRLLDDPGLGLTAAFTTSSTLTTEREPTRDGIEAAGEIGAIARLDDFASRVDAYLDERDLPAVDATSALSVDLHFGTVSPHRVASTIGTSTTGRAGFVRQLAWRDWYAHLLAEVPHLADGPLDPDVGEIAWRNDPDEFAAWTAGRTGYPFVDAGMRELAATGRMHNRLRMVTASFLVKDLLVDWRWGERWFRRRLLDGDVSQNVGNWQWAAGTGPDSAPFFRVFNPTLQSRKFDGDGAYIRRWVPELAQLSARDIHEPAALGPLELAAAGVTLGDNYPLPIVDHRAARERALAAYAEARAT